MWSTIRQNAGELRDGAVLGDLVEIGVLLAGVDAFPHRYQSRPASAPAPSELIGTTTRW
jgi:hypothetical protein